MNVPLSWLSQYVKLPTSEKVLTDRLTMVGHMLDKLKAVGDGVVIDLELRGNRADMFGLIGVARDVAALFHMPLKLPPVAKLPKIDPASGLLTVDKAVDSLIKRFMAIKLKVTVAPSPKWLADRLLAYGIEPINNVVDVTNYVMVETSHPMHAFDADKLSGERLMLRLAKSKEKFETIQQGTTLSLSAEDIAIADKTSVQSITCIGGAKTKVTDITKTIILETAVYDAASCRRTARRHKVATEGGGRHEKHQDPYELPFTLARAIYLLQDIAQAKIMGSISEHYPHPTAPRVLEFDPTQVQRLCGMEIPRQTIINILGDLGFLVSPKKSQLSITVPTFRTDVEESADIVEEIVRIYGYEKIPTKTLSGQLPEPATPDHILLEEQIRHLLTSMQVNEVITNPLIANERVKLFQANGKTFPGAPIRLVNAPDPERATLRPSLLPNLTDYAKRSLGFRQERIAFFEIGKTYTQAKGYKEANTLAFILGGTVDTQSWNKKPRPLTIYDLSGILGELMEQLGIQASLQQIDEKSPAWHPSMSLPTAGLLVSTKKPLIFGVFGQLDKQIMQEVGISIPLFVAELNIEALGKSPTIVPQPYTIAPPYPPIIEDLSFTLETQKPFGSFLAKGKEIDPLIESMTLLDAYENKRTVRVTYADSTRTLSSEDIKPIREKLIKLAQTAFDAILKTA